MEIRLTQLQHIQPMRDIYRHEMHCQVIHDSIHARPGWSREYLLLSDGSLAGYGSVAVGGPWQEQPVLYEYYLLPQHRSRLFDFFLELLAVSGVKAIETQSNDPWLGVMLHTFGQGIASESILFHDRLTTYHTVPDAWIRAATTEDVAELTQQQLDPEATWVVVVGGAIAGAGGILYHYNRPYGDIYMKVAESFRRRGLGCYLVQELKRICYEGGSVPAARCNVRNTASRRTLQKAGFVPCGHILTGTVPPSG